MLGDVRITVAYVEDCPHLDAAVEHVTQALRETGVEAEVTTVLVRDEDHAAKLGFSGSPTVLIDGRDPFPGSGAGFACRLYSTDAGSQGAPSVTQLVEALQS